MYILTTGNHPFLNANGTVNSRRQGKGECERVKEGRYSPELINLMERIMNKVWLKK
jgi:hypothetical protein